MKVTHYTQIPAKAFGSEAPETSIRVLINDVNDNAPVYNLRMIEIGVNGHTPDHSHPYEHENFVVEGDGQVMIDGDWYDIHQGDVVLVPAGIRHQYRNTGQSTLKFLCGIPNNEIQKLLEERAK